MSASGATNQISSHQWKANPRFPITVSLNFLTYSSFPCRVFNDFRSSENTPEAAAVTEI